MGDTNQLLPDIANGAWDWQQDAACRADGPEIFFHPENERGRKQRARDAQAKAVCAACPVRAVCLDWAVSVEETFGVWGGLTPVERAPLVEAATAGAAG